MKVRTLLIFLTALSLLLVSAPSKGQALVEWQVLSPQEFTREKGKPVTETVTFSALGGSAQLKLINGSLDDPSVRKITSAKIWVNGQIVCKPKDFNDQVSNLEVDVFLVDGENTLEVYLKEKRGGQLTIQIVQEVVEVTPEISLVQTGNALRVGNIDVALQGFQPDEKRELILRAMDATERVQFAHELEGAQLVRETANFRFYEYVWTDETDHDAIKFIMGRDLDGNWIIVAW